MTAVVIVLGLLVIFVVRGWLQEITEDERRGR